MPDLPTILARAWWRARVGPSPLIGIEDMERAADHFIRILRDEHGIGFTDATGGPLPPPQNPVIWRAPVADANAERLLRAGNGLWEVVKVEGGQETVQLGFTMEQGALLAGRAMVGDRSLAEVPGHRTILAGWGTVLRLDAAGMEVQAEEASDAA